MLGSVEGVSKASKGARPCPGCDLHSPQTPDALGEGSDYLSHPRKAESSAEMIHHLLPTRTDNCCHSVVPAGCSVTQGSKADPPTLQTSQHLARAEITGNAF